MTRVLIIAEAGVNHNGDPAMALALVDAAAAAGADIVKFQTFKADLLLTKSAPKAEYQTRTTDAAESQHEMIRRLELSDAMHRDILARCKERKIRFLSSAFDLDSIEYLAGLGADAFKVPSGELTNLPYLRKIGGYRRRVILSTGMATMPEIRAAVDVLVNAGTDRDAITILHCTTEYPTPMEDVNLRAMLTIGDVLGVAVGYSDHTPGIEVSIAAAALGATVIEKHFTLDRELPGPDHKASLEPDELSAMVTAIRNVERALGDGVKRLTPSEAKNAPIARKSLVAAKPIRRGETFTEANLTVKRPGSGISPMRWDEILGQKAPRDFAADELIEL